MDQLALDVRFPTHDRNPSGLGTCAHRDFQTLVPLAQTVVVVCKVLGARPWLRLSLGFGAHAALPHIQGVSLE